MSKSKKKAKKSIRGIFEKLLILIFIIGFLVLNYPSISNIYNQYRQSLLISDYNDAVSDLDEEELNKMWEAAEAYNEELAQSSQITYTDAFSDEESEEDQIYNSLLNPSEDGIMGSIEIPKINVFLSVGHGLSDDVLQKGVGHMNGSSLPVGGETSHCLLAAHRGLPSAELFTDLDQIEEGDIFYLHILNRTLKYQVDQIEVVEPEEVNGLTLEKGKDYVTLITCTPYGVNSHRMLVRGVRVAYEEDEEAAATPIGSLLSWILQEKVLLISLVAIILLITILLTGSGGKKNKKPSRGKDSAGTKKKPAAGKADAGAGTNNKKKQAAAAANRQKSQNNPSNQHTAQEEKHAKKNEKGRSRPGE